MNGFAKKCMGLFFLKLCCYLLLECDRLDDVLRPRTASAGRSSAVVERQQEADSGDAMITGSHDGLNSGRRRSQPCDVDGGPRDGRAGDTVDHGGVGMR